MVLLDGKKLSEEIQAELAQKVSHLKSEGKKFLTSPPCWWEMTAPAKPTWLQK